MEIVDKPVVSRDVETFMHNVSIGQYISVELLSKNGDYFNTALVGVKAGMYLILEMPSLHQFSRQRDLVRMGQPLIIRTICEKTTGECLGFHSHILGVSRIPYQVLFVAYPREMEIRSLRIERRQPTAIPAVMSKLESSEPMPGTIVDLSAGGCCLELAVDQSVVRIKARDLYLRYRDPHTNEEQVKLCRVCSQRKEGNKISIGFAFVEELQRTG
jgi:c-di-GMP-binding flagellar brake protein YcgR